MDDADDYPLFSIDEVRLHILATSPVPETVDRCCEIHALTCSRDWLNLIWTLKSFYSASGRRYSLCIHDDGSLLKSEIATLQDHFPSARIIPRSIADARMLDVLDKFPRASAFRKRHTLAPKLLDFAAFLEGDRMAVLDSDLLFFSKPSAFLERVERADNKKNAFNPEADISCYTPLSEDASTRVWFHVDQKIARNLVGHDLVPRINSGFGLVHRASLSVEWIEEFLALPGLRRAQLEYNPCFLETALAFAFLEQTLFALCSSRYGVDLLPEEYSVRPQEPLRQCFRHYNGDTRPLMYSEGMPRLIRSGILCYGPNYRIKE